MRNLTKVLSLVLAVAMVISICAISAGAVNYDDFTDKKEITKTQAVETLVSLNVILGYNGGSTFAPKANVTRAEMATMICRVLAGGDNMIVDATKPVSTYTDIKGHWAESYIEYCTSLGIVSGKGAGLFDPNANVTAAEAAKMVMTALQYNADIEGFKGDSWEINTMAKANTLGLLNNLQNEVSANVALTREQVAQLLYNALTIPMVQNYNGNMANTWIGSGANAYQQTLLESKFNAEKITGVVIANEYANLYGSSALRSGKTRLAVMDANNDITDETVTVDLATKLDDVGMSVVIYRDKTTSRVVYGNTQNSGLNTVTEFTAATKDITKGEGAVDKNALTKDTQYFVNFNNTYGEYVARQAFEYDIDGDGNKYTTQSVKRGDTVTNLDDLEEAFLRGTLTRQERYNSFNDWCDAYLRDGSGTGSSDIKANATANQNGNYIKAVDANKDGVIDYVLKTVYTMSVVTNVAKNGDVTISGIVTDEKKSGYNADKISTSDDLAKNDVVIYTIIDGTAYVQLAKSFEAKVDSYSWKNTTMTTTDGDQYGQSGIEYNKTAMSDYAMDTALEKADDKVSYTFYTDLYGYVRAFVETEVTNNLVLLTDANVYGSVNNRSYAVETWDRENDKFVQYDASVSKSDRDTFFTAVGNADKDTWGELVGAVSGAKTNVAAYSINDDKVMTVTNVNNMSNKLTTKVYTLDKTGGMVAKAGTVKDTSGKIIDTNSSTVYYYVHIAQNGKMTVHEEVGYRNSMKVAERDITAVYAVASQKSSSSNVVADVVVVETNKAVDGTTDTAFIYDVPSKSSSSNRRVDTIVNGEEKTYYVGEEFTEAQYAGLKDLAFYTVVYNTNGDKNEVSGLTEISKNFAKSNIFAGTVTYTRTDSDNKTQVTLDNEHKILSIDLNTTPVYSFEEKNNTTDLLAKDTGISKGDKLIYVTNSKGDVKYIINVTESKDRTSSKANTLGKLYESIATEVPAVEAWNITVKTAEGSDANSFTTNLPATVAKTESTLSFTAAPAAGYQITGVAVTGATLNKLADGSYMLTKITGDVTVTVTTAALNHTLTVTADSNTTVTVSINGQAQSETVKDTTKTFQVRDGAAVTFQAVYTDGYKADKTAENIGKLTEDKTAAFTAKAITYTVYNDGKEAGAVNYNDKLNTVSAVTVAGKDTANYDYTVKVMMGDAELKSGLHYTLADGVVTFNGSQASNLTVTDDITVTFTATGKEKTITVTGGGTSKADCNYQNSTKVHYGESITITVTPKNTDDMPSSVTVNMGGGQTVKQDPLTGVWTCAIDKVTDDITITIG